MSECRRIEKNCYTKGEHYEYGKNISETKRGFRL